MPMVQVKNMGDALFEGLELRGGTLLGETLRVQIDSPGGCEDPS